VVARQKTRLIILFLILLTFPITLNYFSVYLIIDSASQGVMAFSFFFWSLWIIAALVFGRAACGYVCPLGAIQETKDRMAPKKLAKIRFLRWIKYVLAVAWVGAIVAAAISAGGYRTVNLLYNTESGVSVDSPRSWIMYFSIVLVVLLPVFFIGKRGFCHYFCPWGVLNIAGTKIKNFFRWPSLGLKAESAGCLNCGTCDKNCPMSLEVSKSVASGSMDNTECILCGSCADNCPQGVIKYVWKRPEKKGQAAP
jgi:ferredoxin-type protein NapH